MYERTSIDERGRQYRLTATSHWVIDWRAPGRSGTLSATYGSTSRLSIGEIQALVTRG